MKRIYRFLLQLYPFTFRQEFEEEMFLDFSDLVNDAHRKGWLPLLRFWLRELVDYPVNLLKVHYREGVLFKKLRSEPANHAVRGAIGFGSGFAVLALLVWWAGDFIYTFWKPIITNLSAANASQNDWLYMLPFATYFILAGSAFGTLMACFLGSRSNFWRYLVAGAFGWLIPEILSYVLINSLKSEYYRNEPFSTILGYAMLILMGAFFSAAAVIAENKRKRSLVLLSAAIVIYPVSMSLFMKLLFSVWQQTTPGFFVFLIAFVMMLIVGVLAIAMPDSRKQCLDILAGTCAYFLLNRALFFVAYYTPGFSTVSGIGIAPEVLIVPAYHMAVYKGIFGALFGLVLGLLFGHQRKNDPLSIVTAN